MEKNNTQTLGKKMQRVRQMMNLTQLELAKRLYVSRSCIANYESNRRSPCLQTLQQFAKEMNVNMDYLTGDGASLNADAKLKKYNVEIASYLTETGHLDLSNESPIVKIAVVEYYIHLKGKYEL